MSFKRLELAKDCLSHNVAMDSQALKRLLEPCKDDLHRLGVAQLLVVGSVARGESQPDTDLDLVVEFEGPASFLGYMDLLELLERVTGKQIDLTTKNPLRPEVASEVLAEARRIA